MHHSIPEITKLIIIIISVWMGSCLLHDSMVDSVILNLTVPWSVVIQSFFLLQSFLVVLVALDVVV